MRMQTRSLIQDPILFLFTFQTFLYAHVFIHKVILWAKYLSREDALETVSILIA